MPNKNKYILHIDGDAFFASCEVARRPDLFHKPVVVGRERGIATALTYEAKALGIKRGDPIFRIKKEHKNVTILTSHFETYNKYCKSLVDILDREKYIKKIEVYSIDECFVEIEGEESFLRKELIFLKDKVQTKLGITYSFGVSVNKTLSKVASKYQKPNGLTFLLTKEEIDTALKNTKIENVWGIGNAYSRKITSHKIFDAYTYKYCNISKVLGSSYNKVSSETFRELNGEQIFKVAQTNPIQKSLQATRTFIHHTNNKNIIISEMSRNLESAMHSLQSLGLYTNRVLAYIKPKDKRKPTTIRLLELPMYSRSSVAYLRIIEQLFDNSVLDGIQIYRSSGIIATDLIHKDEVPMDMFGQQSKIIEKEKILESALVGIRNKFGYKSIELGSSKIANTERGKEKLQLEENDNYIKGLPYTYLGTIF